MNLKPSPFAPDSFPELPQVKGVRAATGSRGFYAARELDRDDVFLFAFEPGTHCAGVFTRSSTASADVQWCREALANGRGKAAALVVNSGNSNAFTGPKGVLKNEATLAAMTSALDVEKAHCFLGATGVIGEPLSDPNFVGSIVPELSQMLTTPNWEACARAFMTTDTFPKGAGFTREIGGHNAAFAGIAKGSGMIAPNMATMLAYVFTDLDVAPNLLDAALRAACAQSFNAISVDSDTSTSDSLMVFATGKNGAPTITSDSDPRYSDFVDALIELCLDLALQIVKDGEGASKFISVRVDGAKSDASARIIAADIANSPLVKTALAANDANWGRVVMAVGKSGEPITSEHLSIWFGDVRVAESGARAANYDEARATEAVSSPEIEIKVSVGSGPGCACMYTCDLTHAYVDINGAYRT
ncbi:MAG: bifunctional glutamate N-acetyltransferase/amino-acid acetyltransferase ArgJ [Hyphomonadaceae bacterium]|nr:bifunctional glutamate N-acetyltransferase/amino-acid acetyltransferase ArgJ [Hyphomonadaceae bacterium]